MSYCRFCEGDVYAYECDGGVQFFVAGDSKKLDRLCHTYDSAYQYAKYLRDECGLDVPGHAIEALRADAIDESNHGDGSAVAEMTAKINELEGKNFKLREENDKLRRLAVRMRPICMEGQRCTFADRIYINNIMEELGIEVQHD